VFGKRKDKVTTSKRINISEYEGDLMIEILHDGYNIIAKTLYGDMAREYLAEFLQNKVKEEI